MEKFLETYKAEPGRNQKIIDRPIISNEIKTVIKSLSTNKIQDHMALLTNSNIKRRADTYLYSSKELQREEHSHTHSTRPLSP